MEDNLPSWEPEFDKAWDNMFGQILKPEVLTETREQWKKSIRDLIASHVSAAKEKYAK